LSVSRILKVGFRLLPTHVTRFGKIEKVVFTIDIPVVIWKDKSLIADTNTPELQGPNLSTAAGT
jgi:hypothetical protein